jgi:hypothetical protein
LFFYKKQRKKIILKKISKKIEVTPGRVRLVARAVVSVPLKPILTAILKEFLIN